VAKEPAIQLAPGVWRIPLIRDLVNGFMLRDDDQQVTLIDMGVPKSGAKVMAALASIGSGPSDVTRLMLTHAHADHAGGAAYVAEQTGLEFGLHAEDAEFARAGKNPPRDPRFRLGRLMTRTDKGFDAVRVAETFTDGQVIPFAGGIEVVHTPGHSPGRGVPPPRLRRAHHRRLDLQRARAPLVDQVVLHRLPDVAADRRAARRARLHDRRLHPRRPPRRQPARAHPPLPARQEDALTPGLVRPGKPSA
jgi:hypothetical protein